MERIGDTIEASTREIFEAGDQRVTVRSVYSVPA